VHISRETCVAGTAPSLRSRSRHRRPIVCAQIGRPGRPGIMCGSDQPPQLSRSGAPPRCAGASSAARARRRDRNCGAEESRPKGGLCCRSRPGAAPGRGCCGRRATGRYPTDQNTVTPGKGSPCSRAQALKIQKKSCRAADQLERRGRRSRGGKAEPSSERSRRAKRSAAERSREERQT
jgi:hypothetical protein